MTQKYEVACFFIRLHHATIISQKTSCKFRYCFDGGAWFCKFVFTTSFYPALFPSHSRPISLSCSSPSLSSQNPTIKTNQNQSFSSSTTTIISTIYCKPRLFQTQIIARKSKLLQTANKLKIQINHKASKPSK